MLKNKTIQRKLEKKLKKRYATYGGEYYVMNIALLKKGA